MFRRVISVLVLLSMITQQSGFAQNIAPVSGGLQLPAADAFRPAHLRSVRFSPEVKELFLDVDPGDRKSAGWSQRNSLADLFYTGLDLPAGDLWVNLRPDASDEIISRGLENTYLGQILLAADVQLKKDLSALTDPRTPAGRKYWDALYVKAEELYKDSDAEVPAISRPWIVPGEIMIRQSETGAYIYKATLRVKLEEDYISSARQAGVPPVAHLPQVQSDLRFRELNSYSSVLLKEFILPQLNRRVNSAREYAPLRQAYFSLILAQWVVRNNPSLAKDFLKNYVPVQPQPWSKRAYYEQYRRSFENGEYRVVEEVAHKSGGVTVRTYFSGGIIVPKEIDAFMSFGKASQDRLFKDGGDLMEIRYPAGTASSAVMVPQPLSPHGLPEPHNLDGGELLSAQQRDRLSGQLYRSGLGLMFVNGGQDTDGYRESIELYVDSKNIPIGVLPHSRKMIVVMPSAPAESAVPSQDVSQDPGALNDAVQDMKQALYELWGDEGEDQVKQLVALQEPREADVAALLQTGVLNGVFAVTESPQEVITDIMPALVSGGTSVNVLYDPHHIDLKNELFLRKVEIDGRVFFVAAHSQDMAEKMERYVREAPLTVPVAMDQGDMAISNDEKDGEEVSIDEKTIPEPIVAASADVVTDKDALGEVRSFTQRELVEDILMSLFTEMKDPEASLRQRYLAMGVAQEQWQQAWGELNTEKRSLLNVATKVYNKQKFIKVKISNEGKRWLLGRQMQNAHRDTIRMLVSHGNGIVLPASDAQWQLYRNIMKLYIAALEREDRAYSKKKGIKETKYRNLIKEDFWSEMVKRKSIEFMRTTDLVSDDIRVFLNEFFDVSVVIAELPVIRDTEWRDAEQLLESLLFPMYMETRGWMFGLNGENTPLASDVYWLVSRRIQGIDKLGIEAGYYTVFFTHEFQAVVEKIVSEFAGPFIDELNTYTTDETLILTSSKRYVSESQLADIFVQRYDRLYSDIRTIDINVNLDSMTGGQYRADAALRTAVNDVYAEIVARYVIDVIYLMRMFGVRERRHFEQAIRMRFDKVFNYPNPWRHYLLGESKSDAVSFMTTAGRVSLGRFVPILGRGTYMSFLVSVDREQDRDADVVSHPMAVKIVNGLYAGDVEQRRLPENFDRLDEFVAQKEQDREMPDGQTAAYIRVASQPAMAEPIARINFLRLFRMFLRQEGVPYDNGFLARCNVPALPVLTGDAFMEKHGDLLEVMQQVARFFAREKKAFENLGFTTDQASGFLGVVRSSEIRGMIQRGIPLSVVMDALQEGYLSDFSELGGQYDPAAVRRAFGRYEHDPRAAVEALHSQRRQVEEFQAFLNNLDERIAGSSVRDGKKGLQEARDFYFELLKRYHGDVGVVAEINNLVREKVEGLFTALRSGQLSVASPEGKQLAAEMIADVRQQLAQHYQISDMHLSYDQLRIVYSVWKQGIFASRPEAVTASSQGVDIDAVPGEKEFHDGITAKHRYLLTREDPSLAEFALVSFEAAARKNYDTGKYKWAARAYAEAATLALDDSIRDLERAAAYTDAELKIHHEFKMSGKHTYECERRAKYLRGRVPAKDGGVRKTGGIDWRMIPGKMQFGVGADNVPDAAWIKTLGLAVEIGDWEESWRNIEQQYAEARLDHKRIRDFSAACFARPEGETYRKRLVSLVLQLLKNEEAQGMDSSRELKETLLIIG